MNHFSSELIVLGAPSLEV